MRRFLFIAVCAMLIGGCALRSTPASSLAQTSGLPQFATPDVVQRGAGAQWVKLTPHTFGALGAGIVAGADGNMWFIDENAGDLVRMSMTGFIKEFSMSGFLGGNAIALTVGADHKFYVANESSKIVRVTLAGVVQAFSNASGDTTDLGTIAPGPDGNVWFPETAHLGMITPAGVIKEFPYPTGFSIPNQFGTIATGADHNLWFNESGDDAIVKFVIATHKFTEFKLASACTPAGLVKAKDGNIWFACTQLPQRVGRMTPTGAFKLFPGGGSFSGEETFQIVTLGPDGNPWYDSPNNEDIFRVNTATGAVTPFSPPFQTSERPDSLAVGPDGNIWVTTVGLSNVYVKIFHPITLTPGSLKFTATGQHKTFTVAESGTSSWTATSSNTAVATVAQGSPANTFTVTSVGVGTCRITDTDAVKNSASVAVNVQ